MIILKNKKKTRKKYCKYKSFTSRLFEENERWVKCNVSIIYNLGNGNIYTSVGFSCRGHSAHLRYANNENEGDHKLRHKSSLKLITDDEMSNEVERLIRENPSISVKQIGCKTGFSTYRLNRVYMTAKRKLCKNEKCRNC